jgi:hypothetical protein
MTKEEKINFFEVAKQLLINKKEKYICLALREALILANYLDWDNLDILKIFPELNKYKPKGVNQIVPWFPINDFEGRIKVIDIIIEELNFEDR